MEQGLIVTRTRSGHRPHRSHRNDDDYGAMISRRRARRRSIPSGAPIVALLALVLIVHAHICIGSNNVVIYSPPQATTTIGRSSSRGITGNLETKRQQQQWRAVASVARARRVLNDELRDVLDGRRAKEFARLYRPGRDRIDLSYTIVSTHGRPNGNGNGDTAGTRNGGDTADALTVIADGNGKPPSPKSVLKRRKRATDRRVLEVLRRMEREDHLKPPSILTLTLRAGRLCWNFSPAVMTSGLALVSSKFRSEVWYGILGRCLARSGPAFIKWGQWASTRVDMFPEELCAQLEILHASAPVHSWKFTQKSVEEAIDVPPGTLLDVFHSFDPQPLASGSIAQVHRAVLKPDVDVDDGEYLDDAGGGVLGEDRELSPVGGGTVEDDGVWARGKRRRRGRRSRRRQRRLVASFGRYGNLHTDTNGTTVAVKVRHPNVAQLIDRDFRIMLRLADVVDMFPGLRWLNVRSSVEQFSHTMAAQAHLDVEAHHLEVLNYNFRRWPYVGFPHPFFASSTVIIETFERGHIVTGVISEYDRIARAEGDGGGGAHEVMPLDLAEFMVTNGLTIYLKMLLVDNIMHADLHPGNLMICVGDGCSASRKKNMILVDAGMVAHLDEEESENFIGLLASLGEGDGRAAADAVLRFSSENNYGGPDTPEEREEFREDMADLFDRMCGGYGTSVDVGEVLREVLGLIRTHHVRIDANYATLVINALCVEGLARRVAPEYNLLDASRPLLQSYRQLCHSGGRQRSKFRQAIGRIWMPLMYLRKNSFDQKFFRRQRRQRVRGGSSTLRTVASLVADGLLLAGTIALALKLNDGMKPPPDEDDVDQILGRMGFKRAVGEEDKPAIYRRFNQLFGRIKRTEQPDIAKLP